jgi:allantoate deiminase
MTGAVRVDERLLGTYVEELGRIGEVPGHGLFRFQYNAAWQQARDQLLQWIGEVGLEARVDAVGNVFGRLPGRSDRVVLTGSHVDTVPSGGRYDGALGVVGGLAALAALREQGTPERTLEVVALCEEESTRFTGNFFGTRARLGLVEPAEPERRVLADEGRQIGLVEVIPAITWQTVTVRGQQDHAGATPMDLRRDAFQAAAEMSRRITRLVEGEGRPAVLTTGRWEVEPGLPSIVPGLARFSVDLRHPDERVRDRLLADVDRTCGEVAAQHQVQVEIVRDKHEEAATMDTGLLAVLRDAVDSCGVSWRSMPSGAGHDSQLMATRVPTAMVFVPSVEGRSHSPAEFTELADCVRGASVLATALHRLAFEPGN